MGLADWEYERPSAPTLEEIIAGTLRLPLNRRIARWFTMAQICEMLGYGRREIRMIERRVEELRVVGVLAIDIHLVYTRTGARGRPTGLHITAEGLLVLAERIGPRVEPPGLFDEL